MIHNAQIHGALNPTPRNVLSASLGAYTSRKRLVLVGNGLIECQEFFFFLIY